MMESHVRHVPSYTCALYTKVHSGVIFWVEKMKEPKTKKGRHRGEKEMAAILRCVAYGRDGRWQAICVDLDIVVQGLSFEEVRQSLEKSIEMYLQRVSELPKEEQAHFLSRRAPWYVRAKLAWIGVLSILYRSRDGGRHDFTVSGGAHAHA